MLRESNPQITTVDQHMEMRGKVMADIVIKKIHGIDSPRTVMLPTELVVLLPVAWLLSQTGNLTLVWLAFPIAELMSLTLSIIFLRKTLSMADAAMASGKAGA